MACSAASRRFPDRGALTMPAMGPGSCPRPWQRPAPAFVKRWPSLLFQGKTRAPVELPEALRWTKYRFEILKCRFECGITCSTQGMLLAVPPNRRTLLTSLERVGTMAIASVHPSSVPGLIGRSPAAESLRTRIARLAAVSVNVVITGETGTGKQLVARSIHAQANRHGPFILIDGPSISEAQTEAAFVELTDELERSRRSSSSRVEDEGATVFVRNIEHLGLVAQAKLSRILQSEANYEANGSRVPVRVIASSRQDLTKLCERGAFLPDLYYTLSVVSLATVPLRAIREDIPLLLDTFLSEAANARGRDVPTLDGVMPSLLSHTWPGNVREVRNFAARFVLGFNEDGSEYEKHCRPSPLADQVSWFEKEIIVQQLRRHGGNVGAASEALTIPKTTLYEKMQKHLICTRASKGVDGYGVAPAFRKKRADGNGSVTDQNP
jgi:DNA-binding NtrC family response regulator